MTRSIARATLEKAEYFLERAREVELDQSAARIAYAANLEAAIVYGGAIWDHIRSEFARQPGFDTWSQPRYNALRSNPLFPFISQPGSPKTPADLVGQRHLIVHRGGLRFPLTVAVQLFAQASAKASLGLVVIRSKPWYRRSLKTLYEDWTYPIRARLHDLRQRLAARRAQAPQPVQDATVA